MAELKKRQLKSSKNRDEGTGVRAHEIVEENAEFEADVPPTFLVLKQSSCILLKSVFF